MENRFLVKEFVDYITKSYLLSFDMTTQLDKYEKFSKQLRIIMAKYVNEKNISFQDDKNFFIETASLICETESISFNNDIIEEIYLSYMNNNYLVSQETKHFLINTRAKFSNTENSNKLNDNVSQEQMQLNSIINGLVEYSNYSYDDILTFSNDLIRICKKQSHDNFTFDFPNNLGNIILGYEKPDNTKIMSFVLRYKNYMAYLKREGVKKVDISIWWNQNDLGRQTIYALNKLDYIRYCLDRGGIEYDLLGTFEEFENFKKNEPILLQQLTKNYHIANPTFRAFEFNQDWLIDKKLFISNQSLPIELYDRVKSYIIDIGRENIYDFAISFKCKSINAFIRKMIRLKEI